jgi:hypothetical protein
MAPFIVEFCVSILDESLPSLIARGRYQAPETAKTMGLSRTLAQHRDVQVHMGRQKYVSSWDIIH